MIPMPRLSLDLPAIEVTDLQKRYGQIEAVAGLTMTVGRGEVFGFLGPNGAGKTTTVKLLLGLARPTGGSGKILGAPLGDLGARRKVGYLPELFRYQPWLKAREVMTLHGELMGMPRSRRGKAADEALGIVGLADRAGEVAGFLSHGGQKQLELGLALALEPEILLLDEPTAGMSASETRETIRLIEAIARERGLTLLFTEHDMEVVFSIAQRITVLHQGRVIADGPPDEVRRDEAVRRVYLGEYH